MLNGDWKSELHEHDPRRMLLEILALARQAGVEHELFVQDTVEALEAFAYKPSLVREMMNATKQRLLSMIVKKERGKSGLPPPQFFKGTIYAGDVAGTKGKFMLEKNQFTLGIFIAGILGSGKTNIIKNLIIEHKKQGVPILIFDVKNEYYAMLGHEQFHDLLVIDAEKMNLDLSADPFNDPYAWCQIFIDLLRAAGFTILSSHRRLILEQAKRLIAVKGYLDFFDLLEEIEKIVTNKFLPVRDRDRLEIPLEILTSVRDQLHLSRGNHFPLKELLKRDVVIRMHKLSQKLQTFVSSFIIRWLTFFKDFTRDFETYLLCVFDECKLLFAKEKEQSVDIPQMRILFTQMRFLRMGFVLADQHPSLLVDYVTNVFTYLTCTLTSEEEVRSAAHSLLANEEMRQELQNLLLGYALAKVPVHPAPFKIFVPKAPELKSISEDELRKIMQPVINELRSQNKGREQTPVSQPEQEQEKASVVVGVIKEMHEFLQALLEHPDVSVAELYKILDYSARKGTQIKRLLLEQGLIDEKTVYTGEKKRPRKRLRLSAKGTQFLKGLSDG